MESKAIQALRQEQAESLVKDIKARIDTTEPVELYRWIADEMYRQARILARTALLEKEEQERREQAR